MTAMPGVQESIELAGQNLLDALSPARDYLPYWNLRVAADRKARYRFWWPAHNIGRWWDAMLRLEDATGFVVPATIEAAMLANLARFFDNPDHLCRQPADMAGGVKEIELHSLRESLLALAALARFRGSAWAAHKGRQMIRTVGAMLRDDGSWDLERLHWWSETTALFGNHFDPAGSHGRFLEALIEFYQATGDEEAWELADRLARFHFLNSTLPDGTLNRSTRPNHTHSYLGTLRGLLLWGRLTGQRDYIERVALTYQVTVRRLIQPSGFVTHDLEKDSEPETTSPGDVAQLALWLASEGYDELLDDAERLVRACILPSQVVEPPELVPEADEADGDEYQRLSERMVGAYGGVHREPYGGKQAVTDVTAADLHTLVDIYRNIVVPTSAGLRVNFHFDYADERVEVSSVRSGRQATVTIRVGEAVELLVRVPGWTPRDSVQVLAGGQPFQPAQTGVFVRIPRTLLPGTVTLQYVLPEHKSVETVAGEQYTLHWRGDEITAIRPNHDLLPFYPTAGT